LLTHEKPTELIKIIENLQNSIDFLNKRIKRVVDCLKGEQYYINITLKIKETSEMP